MALRTIHINGFKSFAEDTKIHFYHPVTAIVGPNGSGKSNVADAIRFALGEQSMKSLRGGKGEDLIFNGSHKVSRKNRAHVSLTFDNSGKIFDYDASEVELQRLVHRDGVNEYLVNSAKTRLKDKMELIASANIGPTGHHMITQGEADKFVTATPTERRLLIEDALGLNIYKLRRREAELKMEKTVSKLKEVSKLVWEIEPIVKALANEVERLETLKSKETTLVKMYGEMFFLWQKHLVTESLRLENLIADLKAQQETVKIEINDLAERASENQTLTDEEVQLGVKKKKQLEEQSEIQVSITEYRTEIGRIDGELKQLDHQLSRQNVKLSQISNQPQISSLSVALHDVSRLHDEVQSSASLLAAKQAEQKFYTLCVGDDKTNQSNSSESNQIQNEINHLQNEINSLSNKRNEKEIKLRSFETELERCIELVNNLDNEIRGASSDRLESVRELEKKRARQQELLNKLQEAQVGLQELDNDRGHFKARKHKISSLHGASVLETTEVGMAAGESVEARLRDTKRQVLRLEAQLEDVDISSLPELRNDLEVEGARLTHLQSERYDVEQSMAKTKELVGELTNQIELKIEIGLTEVNKNLERFFRILFGGGSCLLRSVRDGDKPGVDIELQLPYKRIKSVHALSGGERSLASLAILFGITLLSPPPFVVLDETDAALDEANSRRYAKLIRELSEHTQLILITHNRETMTFADELYGVTMGSDGVSRLLSVTLRDADSIVAS